jgi:hypothetical protein
VRLRKTDGSCGADRLLLVVLGVWKYKDENGDRSERWGGRVRDS